MCAHCQLQCAGAGRDLRRVQRAEELVEEHGGFLGVAALEQQRRLSKSRDWLGRDLLEETRRVIEAPLPETQLAEPR